MIRPGDRVALVAPAGPVADAAIERGLERCRRLGLVPVLGDRAGARTGYLAGRDRDRAADLASALADPDIAAVWALRGGYGTLRTLEHLDLSTTVGAPKPFIGFSDNTAIHLALHRRGIVSFHGPHAGFEHFPPLTEAAFRAVLMEPDPAGALPAAPVAPTVISDGSAEGALVGGNLALLAAACGTRHQPDTRDAILFLEDVGEPLYRVDRMLIQLRLAGLLDGIRGIALGEFVGLTDEEGGSGPASGSEPPPGLVDLAAELLAPLGVPVVAGFPFGHGRENWTLPLGVRARLDAGAGTLTLLEPATTESKTT
jgi:muramoyltetrapeptide carboxypeptidase